MYWFKGLSYFILIVLKIVYSVDANSCTIPRDVQYRRSVYRPQYGSNTNRYPPGRRIRHGTKIVITCEKDKYHDLVRHFTFSKCQNGRWLPALPDCKVHRRCRAPPAIPHATASEPITPHITFPHGTTVTYTCDEGKMVTGSNNVVCNDGKWTTTNFQCLVHRSCGAPPEFPHATVSESITPNITFPHGTTVTYTCEEGNMATGSNKVVCADGKWTTSNFQCLVHRSCGAPPEFSYATVSESITPNITFPHGTTVTYTCDEGKMATGSNSVVCDDGIWSTTNFQCSSYDIEKKTAEQDCIIPSGARYRRTKYRPQSGSTTSNYPAGSVVSHGKTIVVICKKDIYGDVVTDWSLSECHSGKWIPKLPSCKAMRRCRAPPIIQNATTSERITPYKTFPHGASVTYICDEGKMATGNDTVVCTDGQWSDTNFRCEDDTNYNSDTTTVQSTTPQTDGCSQLTVKNGKISLLNKTDGTYIVTCNVGFRLRSTKNYICKGGKWLGDKPECVRAAAQCKFSHIARQRSILKSKSTGEVINAIYIDHWTQVIQTCKGKKAESRTVKCVNGRWRPRLMSCRYTIINIHRSTTVNRRKRSYSDCEIPNMRGGNALYHDVISGARDKFNTGDIIQHGQKVQRECLNGSMLLPLVEFRKTLITECNDGEWKPSMQRCLRGERDTVFFDNVTTPTTTKEPDVLYTIRINDGRRTPLYLVINGTLRTGVNFTLDKPDSTDGSLRQYNKTGSDVGEITEFRVAYTDEFSDPGDPGDSSTESQTFVSIYKADKDGDGFYIKRYNRQNPDAVRKRYFKDYKKKKPKTLGDFELYENVTDLTACKFKCVEEVNCAMIMYNDQYKLCKVLEKNVTLLDNNHPHLFVSRIVDDS